MPMSPGILADAVPTKEDIVEVHMALSNATVHNAHDLIHQMLYLASQWLPTITDPTYRTGYAQDIGELIVETYLRIAKPTAPINEIY